MGWENVIAGYKIKGFAATDLIPLGSIFMERIVNVAYYPNEVYYSQFPVYKKKNVKKITPSNG